MKRNINIFEFPLSLGLTKKEHETETEVGKLPETGSEDFIFIAACSLGMFSGRKHLKIYSKIPYALEKRLPFYILIMVKTESIPAYL